MAKKFHERLFNSQNTPHRTIYKLHDVYIHLHSLLLHKKSSKNLIFFFQKNPWFFSFCVYTLVENYNSGFGGRVYESSILKGVWRRS